MIKFRTNLKMFSNEELRERTNYHNYSHMFRIILCKLMRKLLKVSVSLPGIIVIFVTVILCITYRFNAFNNQNNGSMLWWTPGFPGMVGEIHCPNNIKCNVLMDTSLKYSDVGAYLFYGSNIEFDKLPAPRRPDDVIWALYHEESPRNVAEFSHSSVLELFNFSSTFSRHSDAPFPLQYLDTLNDITSVKYFVETRKKNEYLNNISSVLFLQSDCDTATEREVYVKNLMQLIPVDSYGSCLNNKHLPEKFKVDYLNNLNDDEFLHFVAKYKFVIAIENGVCDDYVTEKLWRAIKVGSVPIYFGSPSVRDWLPNNRSAILLNDYSTPKLMIEHIEKLNNDDVLYEQYLDHKIKQTISNQKLIDELRNNPSQSDASVMVERFQCMVCDKLHRKLSGVLDSSVVSTMHYNCPKPISVLTLSVNPDNDWVYTWETARQRAEIIRKKLMSLN